MTATVPDRHAIALAAARALYGHGRRLARTDNKAGKRVAEDLIAVATATELAVNYPRLATRQRTIAAGLCAHHAATFGNDTPIGHTLTVCAHYLETR